jgi:hypothetical protein
MVPSLLRGAAAGAAGTVALNATTYLDMAVRGRPSSSTPQQAVERTADEAGVDVPGEGDTRQNRVQGLGSLSGITTGVAVGALLGLLRRLGVRPGPLVGPALAGGLAMVGANVPLTTMGITDPRRWSGGEWLADVVPHVAYGVVTHATLADLDRT